MPVDQQECQAACLSEAVLNLRPGGRRVFAVFLRIQGNGGPFWHLFRGVLHGLKTIASIDFNSVSYNELADRPHDSGQIHRPHEEFTLVVNAQ